jgi:aspartyl/glutamyl-tRNA(Asn/Gln) amidotransferase C subunit
MKINAGHLTQLINMPLKPGEVKKLQAGFESTLKAVDKLKLLKVAKNQATFQVTKLQNVWREDRLQPERLLSQKQALSQAKKTYNGYFVVNRVIDNDA